MAGNTQVLGLLEEMLDSGRTPEEVCRDCPELLPEVRERWKAFCLIDAEVGALLPEPKTSVEATAFTSVPSAAGLPQIPGYEVEAVLGRGGMGVVFKARHLRLNRTVALKMLLAGAYASPDELARFQREAQAVAGLRHANIVQVYDVGDHEGRPYFTMEFVEGGSLAQKLAGEGGLFGQGVQRGQAAHRLLDEMGFQGRPAPPSTLAEVHRQPEHPPLEIVPKARVRRLALIRRQPREPLGAVVGEQLALPVEQRPKLGVRRHFERRAGRKGARHAHPQRGPVRDDDPPAARVHIAPG
jgi:hypothetical protein